MKALKIIPAAVAALALAATASAQTESAMPVKDFHQKFETDLKAAEDKYLGQTLDFHGIVVETGTSIYLTPNVRLSDQPDGQVYLICVLPRSDADKLDGFKKGDQVTVTGRVYRAKTGGGVVVKDCRRAARP